MAASLWFAQQSWGHGAQPQGAQGSVAGCNPSAMGQLWALGGGKAPKWCCRPAVSALRGWEGGSCGGLRLSACRLTGLCPQELKGRLWKNKNNAKQ